MSFVHDIIHTVSFLLWDKKKIKLKLVWTFLFILFPSNSLTYNNPALSRLSGPVTYIDRPTDFSVLWGRGLLLFLSFVRHSTILHPVIFSQRSIVAIVSSNERQVRHVFCLFLVSLYVIIFCKIQATLVVHETKLVQDKSYPSIYRDHWSGLTDESWRCQISPT